MTEYDFYAMQYKQKWVYIFILLFRSKEHTAFFKE